MLGGQLFLVAVIVSCFTIFGRAQVSGNLFYPAAIPLAVRSPYLNSWVRGVAPLSSDWSRFWDISVTSDRILGWMGMVRVDGKSYTWLGLSEGTAIHANITGFQMTPTRSIFNLTAETVDLTITFLTPIDASDLVRQSIPFSYISLEATSNDGQEHSVQVYSDITGEWISWNDSQVTNWTTTSTDSMVYHKVQLQSPSALTELNNQAEDGTLYYAMSHVPGMAYCIGVSATCRQAQFEQSGSLTSTPDDTSFRPISQDWPAYAISVDLGGISHTSAPVVWAVGLIRDPVIQYTDSTGQSQMRSPYFRSAHRTDQDAIGAFLSDFPDALTRSTALDEQIIGDAGQISAEYVDLVSIVSRQVMGSIDITISEGTDGQWNTSDVKIFMKNIGNDRRVNPVEAIYAALPAFLYLNASLVGQLLAPLLEFQDSAQYNLGYAARDIGSTYPVAPGNINEHQQGVEQSGNMLIMLLAHARASGDGTLLANHYNLLTQWANYLVNQSLITNYQNTPDMLTQANQTNLAIKGIIGIQAMSEISQALGHIDDADNYAYRASALYNQWSSLASSSSSNGTHLLLDYGDQDSWSLAYNLYADVLLGTSLVDETIYTNQAQFYSNLFTSSDSTAYGLPTSSDSLTVINSAWMVFAAAAAKDTEVQQALISYAHTRAALNTTVGPFPTVYNAQNGATSSGVASPAQGAMFAPLALTVANTTIMVPTVGSPGLIPDTSRSSTHNHNVGAIVGGVIGGVVAVLGAIALGLYCRRRRQSRRQVGAYSSDSTFGKATPFTVMQDQRGTLLQAYSDEAMLTGATNSRDILQNPSFTSPTPHTTTSNTASNLRTPVSELRTEVEDLRRQVQDMLAERDEPPPTYVSDA